MSSWDDACNEHVAHIDDINFSLHPHINKYEWMQREYHRMVQKHATLFYEERLVKDGIPLRRQTTEEPTG